MCSRLFATLTLLSLSAASLPAQVPLAVMLDPARSELARAWDDTNPRQVERGYCATDWRQVDGKFVVVRQVRTGETRLASPYSVTFRCRRGEFPIHVHTPSTCTKADRSAVDLESCSLGGPDAWMCWASPDDQAWVPIFDPPIGIVQCDRNAFVAYGGLVRSPPRLKPAAYVLALTSGVVAVKVFKIDRDAGGYQDSWTTPDKAMHAVAGFALAEAAQSAGISKRFAVVGICAAAAGFEWAQGFFSYRDLAVGCGGAVISAAWRKAWGR